MAFEWRRANGFIEKVAGVKCTVAQKLERVPVPLVGSGGGHNADLSSGPFAILGAVGVRENVEFPQPFDGEQLPAGSVRRNELSGRVPANAVDCVVEES